MGATPLHQAWVAIINEKFVHQLGQEANMGSYTAHAGQLQQEGWAPQQLQTSWPHGTNISSLLSQIIPKWHATHLLSLICLRGLSSLGPCDAILGGGLSALLNFNLRWSSEGSEVKRIKTKVSKRSAAAIGPSMSLLVSTT